MFWVPKETVERKVHFHLLTFGQEVAESNSIPGIKVGM